MQEDKILTKKGMGSRIYIIVLIGIVLVIIATFFFTASFISSSQKEQLQEQLDLGEKYLNVLDYQQAIIAYEAAIEIDPMSVDAYLRLASVYEALKDYKKAIEVLEDGYLKTGSQLLFDEIERLKLIITKESAQQNIVTLEAVSEHGTYEIAVPGKVVDGIYHNPYYNCNLLDEYSDYLNTIVNLLDAEQYEQALDMVTVEKVDEILNSLDASQFGNGKYFNIFFANKKIHMQTNPWDSSTGDVYIVILPIESGRGYMLEVHNADELSDRSQRYIYGDCQNGVFWGEFYGVGYYEGYGYDYEEGIAINGLLDGSYCQYNDDGYHLIWGYNMGISAIYDVKVCDCGCGGCTYYVDDFDLLDLLGETEPIKYHSENQSVEALKDFYESQRVAVGHYGLNKEDFIQIDGGYRYYLW